MSGPHKARQPAHETDRAYVYNRLRLSQSPTSSWSHYATDIKERLSATTRNDNHSVEKTTLCLDLLSRAHLLCRAIDVDGSEPILPPFKLSFLDYCLELR